MTTPRVPHRIELELIVPGTPEQVWHAIASAEGISSWMMPTDLDPRPGGAITFHMGPDSVSRGHVVGFEPGRRFAYDEDWAALVGRPEADVTPMTTEFLVEARSGGTCVVRVVTSAFGSGADWENEFWEEISSAWAPMLDNLRLYLTHFPDQHATPLHLSTGLAAATPEAAVDAVRRALGGANVGDRVAARGLDGEVERSIARHFFVRVAAPVPGLLSFHSFDAEDGSGLFLQAYLFSDAAPAYVEQERAGWQAWLDEVAAGATATAASPA